MEIEPPHASDPSVAAHVARRFSDASAGRASVLRDMSHFDPRYPGEAAANALSHERAGEFLLAVKWATRAVAASPGMASESNERKEQRRERRLAAGVNAGTVLLRTQARWALGGVDVQQADTIREILSGYTIDEIGDDFDVQEWVGTNAHAQLMGARADVRDRGYDKLTRPHQHHLNLLPRMGALALSEHKPVRAAWFGMKALTRSWMSESERFVDGTSGLTPEERQVGKPKLKIAGRGIALIIGASFASRHLANVPGVDKARQRLILLAS